MTTCVAANFRYEDIESVIYQIKVDDHLVVVDLKKAFHHTPIREADRDYSGFKFQGQAYRCSSLPFGCMILQPLLPCKGAQACSQLSAISGPQNCLLQ